MGVVEQPIADGIGHGSLSELIVPVLDGELAGEDGGAGAVAIVEDLEQVAAVLVAQGCQAPVIEHQDVGAGEAGEQAGVAARGGGGGGLLEQTRHPAGEHACAGAGGPVGGGAGGGGASRGGRSGGED